MSSKSLSSWFLMAGPIGFFVIIMILWPMVIGSQGGEVSAAEEVADMIANQTLSSIFVMLGSLFFVSIFAGYSMIAWEQSRVPGSSGALASVSSVVFIGITTIAMILTGTLFGIIGGGSENALISETIVVVSNGMFRAIFWFWSIGLITLGISLYLDQKMNSILVGLLTLWGVLMVIMHLLVGVEEEIVEPIGFVVFIGLQLITITFGFFNLKSES